MRIESSVTSLSWIPQGATEGFNRPTFRLLASPTRSATSQGAGGPGRAGGPDELRATGRFRLANRLKAWIEVQDGRVVDAGQVGCGRIIVIKAGYGPASIAFTPVALPDPRPSATGSTESATRPPQCNVTFCD